MTREPLHECPAWHTAAIIVLLFVSAIFVNTLDYAAALVMEAQEKELRPIRVQLEQSRAEKKRLVGLVAAAMSGREIMYRDGLTVHFASCTDYAIRTVEYVAEAR